MPEIIASCKCKNREFKELSYFRICSKFRKIEGMLICLSGPDAYRRQKKLREIVAEYQRKHPTARVAHFDLAERGQTQNGRGQTQTDELARLKEFLAAQSLFEKDKLGIVHSLEKDEKEVVRMLKEVADAKDTLVIVSIADKIPNEYRFLAEQPVIAQEFPELTNAELLQFLKTEAAERKIEISGEVAQTLINLYAGDAWGLVTELDKIELGGTVHDHFVMPAFFPLVQSLKNPSQSRRIVALTLLLENEEPAAVFNVLASIADLPLKQKMADYDIAIKSGKLEYEEALTDLAISK